MDIAAWLRELGLDQYERAFLDNAIDADLLPALTAEDLKDIGVTAVGHRRRLLKAIATLREPEQPRSSAPIYPPALRADRLPRVERRQLTVLFCDLVGSTELSARLDPEDMREVIGAYQTSVAEVVLRWGGHVANYMGDGILVCFGWPQAHEDDAERAVWSGLELTSAVGRLPAGAETHLAARVGIATGQVVVGDLIGQDSADRDAVVGETPNLAARLQMLAEPGMVVIAEATRRLLGGLFELDDLGLHCLKGFAEPLAVWRVRGEGRAEGRFEARHMAGLTPLIGREKEITLLLECWQRAKNGEGQVVLVSGEPGIGKSRIVWELLRRLERELHIRLLCQCSPHHTNSALHPVIEQLQRAAGFARDDSQEARLDKLEALLTRGTNDFDQAVPLVAALLGIATGERYPPLDLTPQRQKQLTLDALVDQLGRLSAKPMLLLYEDVHWIDPTTEEFLGLVIECTQRLPVLLLITFRPEFVPPWPGQPRVIALSVTRLGRREGAAMVEKVAGNKALPAEVAAQIVAKTDGVPLFVEELTKTVLESGLLTDAGDHYELAGPLPPLAIPATLHDSLLARLDRLAPVKEVAQIGAVIGREFSYALLTAVADRPEAELQAALDQLVSSELVFRRGVLPEATYSFKHALVQDAAYQSLLKSRRQQLHARVAEVLETRFPEVAETQPEVLAQHCTAAGVIVQAVGYWHKAGQLAIDRSAVAEGAALLTRGLDALRALPDSAERRRRELGLQVALGNALTATKGWAAPEVGGAYARARELCRQGADARQLPQVLWGLYAYNLHCGNASIAEEAAAEMLRLAEEQQDPAAQVAGHRALGGRLMWRGQLIPALAHLERALSLYNLADRRALALLGVSDARVLCLGFTACILSWQGCPDQALVRSKESLAAAHESGQAYTLSHGLFLNCWFHQIRREPRTVRERSAALVALTREHRFRGWLAEATFYRGWALAAEGEFARGIPQMQAGLAAIRAAGMQMEVPMYLCLLGGMYTKAGQPAEALKLLAEALDQADTGEQRWFEAELHRLRGEALLALSSECAAEAETCWRRAMAIAREQGARLWELRAARGLACFWADQGRRAEARALLAPVYSKFTEGFDTADLKEAVALLEELR